MVVKTDRAEHYKQSIAVQIAETHEDMLYYRQKARGMELRLEYLKEIQKGLEENKSSQPKRVYGALDPRCK
jgi:hypothetical protein